MRSNCPWLPVTLACLAAGLSVESGEVSAVAAVENARVNVSAVIAPTVVRVTAAVKSLRRDETHLFDRPDPFDEFSRKFFGEQRKQQNYPLGVGSGVVFDPSGLILTNEHVVHGQKEATVRLESGEVLKAQVLGTDSRVDLAVLKVDAKRELPAAKFGRGEDVKMGQSVFAFGHPFGVGEDPQPTLTNGIVSAVGRTLRPGGDHRALTDLIQTDAAINPGNSGGPLANIRGEVIGIAVAIFTMSKGHQGLAFAIPLDDKHKGIIKTLGAGKKVERGRIGLAVKEMTPDLAKKLGVAPGAGVLVDRVATNGPAAKAGLEKGDVLVAIDGKKPQTTYAFRILAESLAPGQTVEVEVLRKGQPVKMKLVVGRRDVSRLRHSRYGPKAWRGMEVDQIADAQIRKYGLKIHRGVVVTRVHPGSPAQAAGLREGTVIEKLNDQPVETVEQFREMIRGVGRDDALFVTNDGIKLLKVEK